MVRIRLRRMGAKKSPYYRIVVTDKRSPRDGRFIEAIGTYDPNTKPETVNLRGGPCRPLAGERCPGERWRHSHSAACQAGR